ncbi:MAG TPA: aldo/keto reductase [Gaiellaceae bacterium]|jgi:aryl-alcohol dehydrogenase-like predicted oxidoreductase|nr:aldo/keto reductase [Gaiellaceae bacterium]
MERRPLGMSGVEVSRIVLGCGNFGGIGSAPELFGHGESDEEAFDLMDAAWGLGITTFDTADAYGGGRSERAIGKWIASRGYRPEITTKTYNPMEAGQDHGLGRSRVIRQLEASLDRLGLDRVDAYFAHAFDLDTPLEEVVQTFDGLKDSGVIRAWGVSNFDSPQLRELFELGRPSVVQNGYSLLERTDEEDVIPLCADLNIAYEAFSPLAGGFLAGKYRHGQPPPAGSRLALRPGPYQHLLTEETFAGIADFVEAAIERGVTPATLAIAWVLAQPDVTAIVVGPRRVEHLEPAIAALDVRLTEDEANELGELFD